MVAKGSLALGLLLIASVAAQPGIENPATPTPTTLYFHLDARQDFPINTQLPDDRFAQASGLGASAITSSCVPDGGGALNQISHDFHTLYGFSTPGYVQYDIQEQGGPRIHPERGLAQDVQLDAASPATMYFYLETQLVRLDRDAPGEEDIERLPTVVPQVVVEATIRTGDDVSLGAVAFNTGSIIAHGVSEPADLMPGAANQVPDDEGRNVYEFAVPLTIEQDTITAEESFNVRIDIRMDIPPCNTDKDESVMPSNVLVFTDPSYRPRLEWSVLNPLQIEYIHPQFVGQDLLIHTAMNSPWGNYDVDESPGGIEVTITGPSDARSLTRAAFTQRHHEHNHHFEPVDVTYVWPFGLDGAEEGEYTISVSAWNDQKTAQAIGSASFEIGRNVAYDSDGNEVVPEGTGGARGTPGLGPMAVLATLAIALAAFARR